MRSRGVGFVAMLLVELVVKGLVYGCMYAMMAVGLTLVYGLLRILHIAHAGVFALGAYMAVVVSQRHRQPGARACCSPLVVSAVAGVADLSPGLPADAAPSAVRADDRLDRHASS